MARPDGAQELRIEVEGQPITLQLLSGRAEIFGAGPRRAGLLPAARAHVNRSFLRSQSLTFRARMSSAGRRGGAGGAGLGARFASRALAPIPPRPPVSSRARIECRPPRVNGWGR